MAEEILFFSPEQQIDNLLKRVELLEAENKKLWQAIEFRGDDIGAQGKRIRALEVKILGRAKNPNAKMRDARMEQIDHIILKNKNLFISLNDLGKLLGFMKNRKQKMTYYSRYFQLHPEHYEVKEAKGGKKSVRLSPEYIKHLGRKL